MVEVLEDDWGGLDYAVLRLDGDPGDTWGTTTVSGFPSDAGQPITIIQHPRRLPKLVDGGTLAFRFDGRLTYGDLDTDGGSSGSGILQDRTGYLVGVHTNGGCGVSGGANWGESMRDLLDVSPTLRARAFGPAQVMAIL